ncbi:hypothetical protein MJO29_010394 [Puccinia striiformis f. sp. tritici]|uniref:DUF676 domain-containing protein n=1 Tax=Puccinia striiformis f. sp. tritici PST-78 TaxID=1165861 RepID=A0A0L0UYV2_9BASI|nr:hypothetical protein Pst134EA_019456 [Puccinia striiformis f. sp. tritici]KAH9459301.1 hypothetical protein Pst134EA_019456 [Puccinia striiformis f. sp. tritici]KAI7948729.1 hypothetical protein MJO29_010394 [Puccinia striiformis f. sp. tritici]KNE91923.1 hypothetical protein PSTG_14669 [Puccinia striiformis f. sp. tritici PST-78]KNE91924.1 hypothetical protein, variant [Puccinia striiformis f. sp. tritici PST-78]
MLGRAARGGQTLSRPTRTTTTRRRWLSIENSNQKHRTSKLESLMNLGPILYDPIRIPRHPIVLCHGLYGFAVRGPSSFPRFQIHYWGKLLEILRSKLGVKVIIGKVPPTGTIEERAIQLDKLLQNEAASSSYSGKIPQFNFIAHSMGGLDARYLISHLKPKTYNPISLTTICTPHRGSPFMDWCRANIGVGLSTSPEDDKRTKSIPFSLKEPLLKPNTSEQLGYLPNNLLKVLLLNILDSPAYSNLSTHYLIDHFNPTTPNHSNVKYFSIAAKIASTQKKSSSSGGLSMVHPLWLPSLIMDRLIGRSSASSSQNQGGHDGLVTVDSAKWGEFLGVVDGTDHWEIRGSSAFGSDLSTTNNTDLINDDDDHGLKLVKSNWIELNKYIGSWLSSNSSLKPPSSSVTKDSSSVTNKHQILDLDRHSISTKLLADWIVKKLPLNLYSTSNSNNLSSSSASSSSDSERDNYPTDKFRYPFMNPSRTIEPSFPLDDLDIHQIKSSSDPNQFDLELFYLALCRNLYDHGL